MGCGSSKTRDEFDEEPDTSDSNYAKQLEDNKKVTFGTAYNKDLETDLTSNTNKFISDNTNFYKKQKKNVPFTDDHFPPNAESFMGKFKGDYVDKCEERRKANLNCIKVSENDIEWKHIKEIYSGAKLFGDKIQKEDVTLGSIPDSYFISVLISLTEFPQLIFQLFKTVTLPDSNDMAIEIALKIDGDWKVVLLDDMIPVKKGTKEPIGAKTNNEVVWGLFLEKAWAKINGGYANICIGNPKDVFETLTPFACLPIEIATENPKTFWKNIRDSDAFDCIMTCSTDGRDNLKSKGLLNNHTYCLRSAYEKPIFEDKVKLLKLNNPFGKGEWNGEWSDNSDKWNDETKELFQFGEKKDDGEFYISYEDFIQYFSDVAICVPYKPFLSRSFKIQKEETSQINVMKIKLPKPAIMTIDVSVKKYNFHRKITPEQEVISNVILAYVDGKEFVYIDSAHNEILSTEAKKKGEYVILHHVDYKNANVPPRKYTLSIGSSVDFEYCICEPDTELNLLKSIIITKVPTLPKYQERFNYSVALCTGNRFMNTAYAFFFIQNRVRKDAHIKITELNVSNAISLEGDYPPNLKLEKYDTYVNVFIKLKLNEDVKTSAKADNAEKVEENVEEFQPQLNSDVLKAYRKAKDYQKDNINFEFSQQKDGMES